MSPNINNNSILQIAMYNDTKNRLQRYPDNRMASSRQIICTLCAFLLVSPCFVQAEPSQYCRYGDPSRPNENVDFCLAVTSQLNTTTKAHNVYLTFTHTRRQMSATGWTAIGIGDEMSGSLMFIVYGDPASGHAPIVSIRASTGHQQPTLVTRDQLGGGGLRVLRSDWVLGTASEPIGTVTATVSILCSSCTLWPGTTFSAKSASQPWIWAWNNDQEFEVYDYETHLKMHAHHAGNGGWGRFYVNMQRAESASGYLPSVPVIRPGVAALGASESPNLFAVDGISSWLADSPIVHLHGSLMAFAFLLLFPAGVFGMRSGSNRAFKNHWIIQAAASLVTACGTITGLTLQHNINTTHQIIGVLLSGGLTLQVFLGYKHHMDFIRINQRTWISYSHIWIGRLVISGGSTNLVLGLLLRGYSRTWIWLTVTFVILESAILIVWVWRQNRKAISNLRAAKYQAMGEETGPFIVADDDDDEETDYDEQNLKVDDKKKIKKGEVHTHSSI